MSFLKTLLNLITFMVITVRMITVSVITVWETIQSLDCANNSKDNNKNSFLIISKEVYIWTVYNPGVRAFISILKKACICLLNNWFVVKLPEFVLKSIDLQKQPGFVFNTARIFFSKKYPAFVPKQPGFVQKWALICHKVSLNRLDLSINSLDFSFKKLICPKNILALS